MAFFLLILMHYEENATNMIPHNGVSAVLVLPGMPDFLDKLHTAALKAKNLEVGIHDYTSRLKPKDAGRQPSPERLAGENAPGPIYA